MEPTIVKKESMLLVGLSFFGDPFKLSGDWTEENEIGRLWSRFISFFNNPNLTIKHFKDHHVMYEVHIEHEGFQTTGEYEVFVGLEVEQFEEVPLELNAKTLPPSTYAKFTFHGEEIISDWPMKISRDWFSTSDYKRASAFHFQQYDERFKGLDKIEESAIDVFIPVKK
jgi:AraC family transcriptional regulator